MTITRSIGMLAAAVVGVLMVRPAAAQLPGQVWRVEFEHAAQRISLLAEAIPADKFAWQPGPGVRSTAEVCMHIGIGNYLLLSQAGVKSADEFAKLGAEHEKAVTAKDEVIEFMKGSFIAVRTAVPTLERTTPVKFFGRDSTVDAVLLRLLVHNHEHMGQLIAYARMNGVVPPWSGSNGPR